MSKVDEGHKERTRAQLAAEIASQKATGEKLWGQINANISSGAAEPINPKANILTSAELRLRTKKQDITNAAHEVGCLKGQTDALNADLSLQKGMPSKIGAATAKFVKPPTSSAASTLMIMARTLAESELVHSVLFDRMSVAAAEGPFNLALSRVPNVNENNSKGLKILYPTCMHLFEYGIRGILHRGSITSDTFIQLVHEKKIEAYKMLVRLTQQILTCHEIFTPLQTDKVITYLDLSSSGLMPDGVVFLTEYLKCNKTISILNLANNNVGEIGSEGIAAMFEVNYTIREIDLTNCQIGFAGAKPLSLALESQNKSLKKIILRGNNLGTEGGIIIAECLGLESRLFEVDLSHNNIGEVGAIFIAAMLVGNLSIAILNLASNNITISGIEAFEDTISANQTLVAIDFTQKDDVAEMAELLDAPISSNSTLLSIQGLAANPNAQVKCTENLAALKAKIASLKEAASGDFTSLEILILFQQLKAAVSLDLLDSQLLRTSLLTLKDLFQADIHSKELYSSQLLAEIDDLTQI